MTQTYLTLNDGNKIPQFGLGVFQVKGNAATKQLVKEALDLGYRHIDTAHAYENERGVGEGIRESNAARQDLWLTSKLWPTDYGKAITPTAIDKMLQRLGTDYLDLLLLHQSFGDYVDAWGAMEDAVKAGKVRSIGLSNFEGTQLNDILSIAKIRPAIMQTELHPYYHGKALKEKLASAGTQFEAYYPLGHGDTKLLNEPIFSEIGQKYGKSNVQVILRWHLQSHNIVFPKSTKRQHLKDNFDIFDFSLNTAEMNQINSLDKHQRYYNSTPEEAAEMFKDWHLAD